MWWVRARHSPSTGPFRTRRRAWLRRGMARWSSPPHSISRVRPALTASLSTAARCSSLVAVIRSSLTRAALVRCSRPSLPTPARWILTVIVRPLNGYSPLTSCQAAAVSLPIPRAQWPRSPWPPLSRRPSAVRLTETLTCCASVRARRPSRMPWASRAWRTSVVPLP